MSQLERWKKQWDPFKEFGLFPRLDRFFDEAYAPALKQRLDQAQLSPNVEVHETKGAYSLRFDLPGVSKEQIKIDLHDNTLTVSGERREEKREEYKDSGAADRKTHLSEVYYGSFSRTFTFPEAVDSERTEAKFENGVLSLNLPKKETTQRRQISIR